MSIARDRDELLARTPLEARSVVWRIAERHLGELGLWYERYLLDDDSVRSLALSDPRRRELVQVFKAWVASVFSHDYVTSERFMREQEQLGGLLARVGYPPHALSRALRRLKGWFLDRLAEDEHGPAGTLAAARYVIGVLDLALELREMGYSRQVTTTARLDEAYRLHSIGQNLALERERQRSMLMEWSHRVLMLLHQTPLSSPLPRLGFSEFGLWVKHKGRVLFERAPEFGVIMEAVRQVDRDLLPLLSGESRAGRSQHLAAIAKLEEVLTVLKFNLNALFDAHVSLEAGRDPLTQLLNRRFLPTVLSREITLHSAGASEAGFAVLLVDVDDFKGLNDRYGHGVGDAALQHLAVLLGTSVRPSDFVFRYGGEEFVIVLVESGEREAEDSAERVAKAVAASPLRTGDGLTLTLTVSIGIACYEGELEYEELVARADRAMYLAKQGGKNRAIRLPR